MSLILYPSPHENTEYLIKLFNKVNGKLKDGYWFISDAYFVPKFKGDYCGEGGETPKNLCVEFNNSLERESGGSLLSHPELITILEDTQTVNAGVLIYFSNNFTVDKDIFYPTVEREDQKIMSHSEALYEISILDGDMFNIFDNLSLDGTL